MSYCIILINIHLCIQVEPDATKQEQELQVEPAPVEDITNPFNFLSKASPRCIAPNVLVFSFANELQYNFICALSL
jgi:hypothetical protein